jgi:hypothetical protein
MEHLAQGVKHSTPYKTLSNWPWTTVQPVVLAVVSCGQTAVQRTKSLFELSLILEGEVFETKTDTDARSSCPASSPRNPRRCSTLPFDRRLGLVDVDALCDRVRAAQAGAGIGRTLPLFYTGSWNLRMSLLTGADLI